MISDFDDQCPTGVPVNRHLANHFIKRLAIQLGPYGAHTCGPRTPLGQQVLQLQLHFLDIGFSRWGNTGVLSMLNSPVLKTARNILSMISRLV
jgi:hypothetical protein